MWILVWQGQNGKCKWNFKQQSEECCIKDNQDTDLFFKLERMWERQQYIVLAYNQVFAAQRVVTYIVKMNPVL